MLTPIGDPPADPDRQVEPSILSADYSRLGEQVATVMDAGARVIHVDVMDGHFVPPITIGPVIVESIREQVARGGGHARLPPDGRTPERQIDQFVAAGADSITVQAEATPNVHYVLKQIREAGCLTGLAINPGTPVDAVAEVLDFLDLVLCMTVNPGWGGRGVHGIVHRQGGANAGGDRRTPSGPGGRRHRS